ncbi:MAG: GNAT family N-acetyltransferase [Clostridiales bacterium]|nr:GNAT family N-acetyltransferase [Clostridiales bacterium]
MENRPDVKFINLINNCFGDMRNISNLVADKKFRRQGHTRALLESSLAHMQKRGANPIKLTVVEWNSGAVALYDSLGFRIAGETLVEETGGMGDVR